MRGFFLPASPIWSPCAGRLACFNVSDSGSGLRLRPVLSFGLYSDGPRGRSRVILVLALSALSSPASAAANDACSLLTPAEVGAA